jgi:RNA polymerase sigma-70 factor (ECF subfamily)
MRKKDHISDAQLVVNYRNGDQKAIAILVKRWHQTFCKVAYRYTKDGDVAKDIAQESWRIILNKLIAIEHPEKFKSWAVRIVTRRSLDWLRTQHREQTKLHDLYQESSTATTETTNDQKDDRKRALLLALSKLSTKQQYTIRLFYLENYSLKEIAEITKVSIGTAKSRLFKAREKLKSILKK